VRLGALVNPGTTLLNTLSSTSPIAVEFRGKAKGYLPIYQLQAAIPSSDLSLLLPNGKHL
jgi:membrane fusion protein (multidrug efflux system)